MCVCRLRVRVKSMARALKNVCLTFFSKRKAKKKVENFLVIFYLLADKDVCADK